MAWDGSTKQYAYDLVLNAVLGLEWEAIITF